MSGPGRLQLFEFANFSTFSSSQWKGRETKWFEIAMNLLTIYSYVNYPPAPRLLDIAPGAGHYSVELARSGDVDVHTLVTESRQEEWLGRLSSELDGMPKPFLAGGSLGLATIDDASFDLVLALDPGWQGADADLHQSVAQEIARILVPKGWAFVTFQPRTAWIAERLLKLSSLESDATIHEVLGRESTAEFITSQSQLDDIFASAGLTREEAHGSTFITRWLSPEFWAAIRRRGEDEFEDLFALVASAVDDEHAVSMSTEAMAVYGRP